MSKGIDVSLFDDYKKICDLPDETERKIKLIKFFKIPLDLNRNRVTNYQITTSPLDDSSFISIFIKDESTNFTYSANYENNNKLLKYPAKHVKHINVHISYPFSAVERELIFSRFNDCVGPLHEEVFVTLKNKFRLTLIKIYPSSTTAPYEQGLYLSLSEYSMSQQPLFFEKIIDKKNVYFPVDINSSFDSIVEEFILTNNTIFEKIMKKIEK